MIDPVFIASVMFMTFDEAKEAERALRDEGYIVDILAGEVDIYGPAAWMEVSRTCQRDATIENQWKQLDAIVKPLGGMSDDAGARIRTARTAPALKEEE